MNRIENKIVVAGAGVSGIRAAFDLVETGNKVLLIDKSPGYGGILPQLDHQFPDNHCGMCKMLPMMDRDMGKQFCLKKGLIHENIDIMRSCEITDVKGSPGNLEVIIKQKASGIDKNLCINCGKCEEVCPVSVTDKFNDHLSQRKAVYFPVPFQIPNNRTIDPAACTKCGECQKVCEPNAIDLTFEDKQINLNRIQSVILATGNVLYNPEETDLYGFGILENVVTSTGFERLISQSGPTKGEPLRPSDNKKIQRIAWIQCVGSRNVMTKSDYCSSVCCLFSLKEAVLAKEKIGKKCDTDIFYMDMRTYGRDFQRYRDRAKETHGVKFIRCRVHSVEQDLTTGDPKITYMDDSGNQQEEVYDLVVLATGKSSKNRQPDFTRIKGVHVINKENEFKDISETVIDASCAAAKAGGVNPVAVKKRLTLPKETPKFLVVVCNCGSTQKKSTASDPLIDRINHLPGHMEALRIDTLCSQKGFDDMINKASEPEFNRLIILSCSSDLFQARAGSMETETGILSCHMDFLESNQADDDILLSKIISSYSTIKTRNTWQYRQKEVIKHCIIAGAGPAGLAAADTLSRYDIPVTLVEKQAEAGGNLKFITSETEIDLVKKLKAGLKEKKNISLMTESELASCTGTPGRFSVSIKNKGGFLVIPAGAVILATGGEKRETKSYQYDNNQIITLFDLEQILESTDFKNKEIVMIQCVDSREEPDNYCSRICCIKALKTAIKIKDKNPESKITILYRDIMTYGEYEKIYTDARRKGIRFIPYSRAHKPKIKKSETHAEVTIFDPVLQENVQIMADLVSLSTGIRPYENKPLVNLFGLNKTQDGFIKEADYKWRPVDLGKEGLFACGLARRPLNASEAVKEGSAAALRAVRILNKDVLTPQMVTAVVRHTICSRCELCISSCPYNARYLDTESQKIKVDDASCQACGTCASVCQNNATVVSGFEDGGVMTQIENLI